ncbi:tripartite tricarboxylate transporter TctB family protein [Faunimonas sp. B44]|uniref:tripartite tricarboxylate transporter TctB family protein n=1 Tax=Faunimonas sp. B44 TaxID=3461493 RepID=UPI004044A0D5
MGQQVKDMIFAVSALALGGLYLVATYRLPTRIGVDPLGPKAFPTLIGIAMVLFALGLLVQTVVRARSASPPRAGSETPQKSHAPAIAAVAAGLLLYYVLYQPLGFLVSTVVFLFTFLSFFNKGRPVLNLTIAIAFPVALNIVFTTVLGTPPARGILHF